MGKIVIYIVLLALLPMALLILFLDPRGKRVILAYICGLLVCLSAYYTNTFLHSSYSFTSIQYTTIYGPINEEILKFIPLFIFSVVFKKRRRQTIAMAFALGVGFCVVENTFYLINNIESSDVFWIIARCLGTGLMHSLSSTIMGYCLYRARIDKSVTVVLSISSLFFAIMYHGLFNLLVSNLKTQVIGVLLSIISYIAVLVVLNFKNIKNYINGEDINTLNENKESN